MIVYVENSEESTKKLPELSLESSRDIKTIYKKSNVFLYLAIKNCKLKFLNILFIIAPKSIK